MMPSDPLTEKTQWPRLSRAPITEAIVDVRTKLEEGFDPETLQVLHQRVSARYPKTKKLNAFSKSFHLGPGPAPADSSEITHVGFLFRSEDEKQIFQARSDGFTFNRLYPYTCWDEVRPEAARLWQLYRQLTNPKSITRIALRYINNLHLPLPIESLSEFLTAPVNLPPGTPSEIESYLARVVVSTGEPEERVIVTQRLEPGLRKETAPIILDIDAFRRVEGEIGDEEIWKTLEHLRNLKNTIFFNSLTPRALELYK